MDQDKDEATNISDASNAPGSVQQDINKLQEKVGEHDRILFGEERSDAIGLKARVRQLETGMLAQVLNKINWVAIGVILALVFGSIRLYLDWPG